MRLRPIVLALVILAPGFALATQDSPAPVVVKALAVAQTEEGLVGTVAEMRVTASPGAGYVFLDTRPLARVDMQGSARLAVRVATTLLGEDAGEYDFHMVIRSASDTIGGPSAGALLTVAAAAALRGWPVANDVYMTGTINPDGSIGPVGGVAEKASAAAQNGARLFLYPSGEETVVTWTSQGRALVNMTPHCKGLRIECRPVTDIREALEAFTGYRLERPEMPTGASDDQYLAVMRPLALEQYELATRALNDTQEERNVRTANRSALLAEVDRQVALAQSALSEAERLVNDETYYTASSKTFLALISLRFANLALDALDAESPDVVLQQALADATQRAQDAQSAVANYTPTSPSQLQALSAAETRARDAGRATAQARARAAGGDGVSALYQSAYAMERADTVFWWLQLAEAFEGNEAIDAEARKQRAMDALDEAEEHLAYSRAVLEEASGTRLVTRAEESLAQAQASVQEGRYAAAIFDALEAQVRASLALEAIAFGDAPPPARIQRSQAEAERAIAEARVSGAEPILAASQFEFAQSLDDARERLALFDLARIIARSEHMFASESGEATRVTHAGAPVAGGGFAIDLREAAALVGGLVLGVAVGYRQAARRARVKTVPLRLPVRVDPLERHEQTLAMNGNRAVSPTSPSELDTSHDMASQEAGSLPRPPREDP